jgi:transcriptional regulator with XRE-family HTH domain
MSDYQGEKFKLFLKGANISVIEASKKLGVSRNTVYQYFGSDNLSRETVINIITKFNVHEEEIFGRQESKQKAIKPNARLLSHFPDENGSADGKYLFAPDGSMGMKVYTVPAKAQAGYLRGYPDPEYYEDFEYVIIPVDKKHSGEYLSFEVQGDSMVCLDSIEMAERSVFPGRVAVGRFLERDKWYYKLHIHNYDYWVIAHKTKGILIKAITKHDVDKGIITIHSLNPSYQDEDLKLDEIEQVFSVVQIVTKTR